MTRNKSQDPPCRRPSLAALLIGLAATIILIGAFQPVSTVAGYLPDFQIQIDASQFIARAGSGANLGIVFTPTYGFAGTVRLNASISPVTKSVPTVNNLPSSVFLNASLGGSPLYFFQVNTTSTTPIGIYTLAVTGISGSISHTVTALIGVTHSFVSGNGAELEYNGNFTSRLYAGGSTVLNNTFEDLGYVDIGIQSITVSTSFGVYQETTNPLGGTSTLNIAPFHQTSVSLTIQIPANTPPGNYQFTATIKWIVGPYTIYAAQGPDLVTHGNVTVYANPAGPLTASLLTTILFAGLAVAAAAIIATVGVVLWKRKLRKSSTVNQGTLATSGFEKDCPICGTVNIGGGFCPKCGYQYRQDPSGLATARKV